MKKMLITLLTFVTAVYQTNAQTTTNNNTSGNSESEQFFTFGPRAGLNISNFSGADDSETKAGLLAGGFLVYSFQEHFGVSVDALYSVEGAQFTERITANNTTIKIDNDYALNYLRLPVQANVFFGEFGNRLRPKITLGPSVGFLLSAKNNFKSVTTDGNGGSVTLEDKDDVKSDFKGIDFGAIVGAGLNYRLTDAVWWNLDLRYYLGATNIDDDNNNSGNNNDLKNNSFSVSLGIGFGL